MSEVANGSAINMEDVSLVFIKGMAVTFLFKSGKDFVINYTDEWEAIDMYIKARDFIRRRVGNENEIVKSESLLRLKQIIRNNFKELNK